MEVEKFRLPFIIGFRKLLTGHVILHNP